MTIYIPENLRNNIKVISDMYRMLKEYSDPKNSYQMLDVVESYDDYRYMRKIDPVQYFIELNYTKPEDMEDTDYSDLVKYISTLFYSVRGTQKVFEYMQTYLGIQFSEGTPKYTPKCLRLTINSINTEDENMYYEALLKFLHVLLYFETEKINIGTIEMTIQDKIEMFNSADAIYYNIFNATRS